MTSGAPVQIEGGWHDRLVLEARVNRFFGHNCRYGDCPIIKVSSLARRCLPTRCAFVFATTRCSTNSLHTHTRPRALCWVRGRLLVLRDTVQVHYRRTLLRHPRERQGPNASQNRDTNEPFTKSVSRTPSACHNQQLAKHRRCVFIASRPPQQQNESSSNRVDARGNGANTLGEPMRIDVHVRRTDGELLSRCRAIVLDDFTIWLGIAPCQRQCTGGCEASPALIALQVSISAVFLLSP